MNIDDAFEKYYNREIQLSRRQARAIGEAILSRQPNCRTLIFGVGNDTGLWLALGEGGAVHFMETSAGWLNKLKSQYPNIHVTMMPTFGLTVSSSMDMQPDEFLQFPLPGELSETKWDVILVDAPPGHLPTDPGRAVAISWAARLANEATHIFVDDYERPLESRFVNAFLRDQRARPCSVISASENVPGRKLFWSVGANAGDEASPGPCQMSKGSALWPADIGDS